MRDGYELKIYDTQMTRVLTIHNVTWSRRDSYCKDQYAVESPEEHPSTPVKIRIQQTDPPQYDSGFEKYNFEEVTLDE